MTGQATDVASDRQHGAVHARPLLGITACTRPLAGETAQAVIDRYVEAAALHADCIPVLIPARPDLFAAEEMAARIDGLLLTGSPSNVAPARYGEDGAGDGPFDAGRDAMSLALIAACRALGKPVFGICRGFQEVNVAFGGTLARDLGAEGRALPHHAPADAGLADMFAHAHPVALAGGGLLARAFGRDALTVNSVHYQGVAALGQGLTVEARAPDGVVEAVSGPADGPPLLAVQWHPEWGADDDVASRRFFALLGRALRGQPLVDA
jgi:putative glutamine amidotransferase